MDDFGKKYPYGHLETSSTNLADSGGDYVGNEFKIPAYANVCVLDYLSASAERTYTLEKNSGAGFVTAATLFLGEEVYIEAEATATFRFVVSGQAGDELYSYSIGLRNDQDNHSSSSTQESFSESTSSQSTASSSSESTESSTSVGLSDTSSSESSSSSSQLLDLMEKVYASDASLGDNFGCSVDIQGHVAIIGAEGADAAYVFNYDEDTGDWTEVQKISHPDGNESPYPYFGTSVSLSGSRVAIGANFEHHSGKVNAGAVYIYNYNGSSWSLGGRVYATDAEDNDYFGTSVSLDGSRLAVGSPSNHEGAVYIYDYDGEEWAQTQQIRPSDGVSGDNFGFDVTLYGNRVCAGSPSHNFAEGAIYIFNYSGGVWSEFQKKTASVTSKSFGASVSMDSLSRIVVGAAGEDINRGALYVFEFNGFTWAQTQRIAGIYAGSFFGQSVSLSGDEIMVGAPSADSYGSNAGAAHVYKLSGSVWSLSQTLPPSGTGVVNSNMGISVSINSEVGVVGAKNDGGAASNAGAAYIFNKIPFELSSTQETYSTSSSSSPKSDSTQEQTSSESSSSSSPSSSESSSSSSSAFGGFNSPAIDRYEDYLKAYWAMSESAGSTRIDTKEANDMADTNTVTTRAGKRANAAEFDDDLDQYLSASDASDISPTASFAISMWVWLDDLTPPDGNYMIMDKQNSYAIYYNTSIGNELSFYLQQSNDIGVNISGISLSSGSYNHIVFIAYSGNVYAYVNNVEEATAAYDNTIKDSTGPLYIGRRAAGNDSHLDGAVDEVGFWNGINFDTNADRIAFVNSLYNNGNGRFFNTPIVSTSSSSSDFFGGWDTYTVIDSGDHSVGIYNDLAINHSGLSVYYDSQSDILRAHNSEALSIPDIGPNRVGQHLSVIRDSNNRYGIAYRDATTGNLMYVRSIDSNGTRWGTPVVVDSVGDHSYCSAVFANSAVVIAYWDQDQSEIMSIRSTNYGSSWSSRVTLATGKSNVKSISLAETDGGYVAAAYRDGTSLYFKRAADSTVTSWGTEYSIPSVCQSESETAFVRIGPWNYVYYISSNNRLECRVSTNVTGIGAWGTMIVDTNSHYRYLSRAVRVSGASAIAAVTSSNLCRYYRVSIGSGSSAVWSGYTVDSGSIFGRISLAQLGATNPVITVFNDSFDRLSRYVANDTAGTSWSSATDVHHIPLFYKASFVVADGKPAVIFFDSANSVVQYAWQHNGVNWKFVDTQDFYYSSNGYQEAIAAETVNGNPAYIVYDGSGVKYSRAENSEGSSWVSGISTYVDEHVSVTPSVNGLDLMVIKGYPAAVYTTNTQIRYKRSAYANGDSWGNSALSALVANVSSATDLQMVIYQGKPVVFYRVGNSIYASRSRDMYGSSWEDYLIVPTGSISLASDGKFSVYNKDGRLGVSYFDNIENKIYFISSNSDDLSEWSDISVVAQGLSGSYRGRNKLSEYAGFFLITYVVNGSLKVIDSSDANGEGWSDPVTVYSHGVTDALDVGVVESLPIAVASTAQTLFYSRLSQAALLSSSSTETESTSSLTETESSSVVGGFNSEAINKYNSYLEAYWHLDEEGGARSDEVGSNDLQDNNNVGYADYGKYYRAAEFVSADENVLDIIDTSISISTGFAISCWGMIDSQDKDLGMCEFTGNGTEIIDVFYAQSTDTLEFWLKESLAANQIKLTVSGASAYFSAGSYHNVVAIAANGNMYLYVDGVQRATTAYADTVQSVNELRVGLRETTFSDGVVDELALWTDISFASTSDRNNFVAALYNGGAGDFYKVF